MLVLLSPAKSLDFESNYKAPLISDSEFLPATRKLVKQLKTLSKADIKKLMGISDKLALLNWERYQEFKTTFNESCAKPAIFAFTGDVYQGFEVETLSQAQLKHAQKTILILSGLYGALKPLDLMQPYRLEMGCGFAPEKAADLYEFWQAKLTKYVASRLKAKEPLVNLASNEYSKAVDLSALSQPVVSPVFKDYKNGKYKIISFYAKKARGMMARFIVETKAKTIEDLQAFDYAGYGYDLESSTEFAPVFLRKE